MPEHPSSEFCAICIDTGTTNTRVWLVRGEQIIARTTAMVGVRDTARDGSSEKLRTTLRNLIAELRSAHPAFHPACVIAAGMITSPLGLVEVPHVQAPTTLAQLAAVVREAQFAEVTDLPVLLIPGVRSGNLSGDAETIAASDVMRGEETLCAGLIASARIALPATLLNLGSHWKAIQLDNEGRLAGSITSLSGELIHATITTTILASALPASRPVKLSAEWIIAGMREQRRSGLARALFCVRLLELAGNNSPEDRFAFLAGAFIASDLDALKTHDVFSAQHPVYLAGGGALAEAWQHALAAESIAAVILTETEVEAAFLAGLRSLAELTLTRRGTSQ